MRELFSSRRGRSTFTVPREDSVQHHPPPRHPASHIPRHSNSNHSTSSSIRRHTQHPPPHRHSYHHYHEPQQPAHRPNYRRSSSRRSRSSNRSHSQPSTAAMTEYRSTASVPSYVGNQANARFSDDDTSWMSGVESHPRSVATSSCSSSPSAKRNSYLRDGKTIKRVIDDLIRAEDSETTLSALSIICVEFDHNDTVKHNAELYYGAITVLSEKLSMTDHHDAIRLICAATEMAFRGGTKYVKEAFHVNAPTMMPLLLRLLDRCEQSKVQYADEIILNITKTFHYLSRIGELRVSLARQPGLLDSLQRVATSPLNVPCRNARVRVMANLANSNENKVLMYAHRGLLNALLKIAQLDLVDATREYATIALMDLASAPANQVPLAKNGQVLRVLTAMVVAEKVTTIRESATTTIQNLAFPKSNRLRLVEFQGGLVMEALLSVLQKDTNEKARRRAGGALTNMAYEGTAERMARFPGLLSRLAEVSVQEDTDADVQSRACLALTKIASNIGIRSESYGPLMDALVVASDTLVDNNISAVFRLRAREAECRESMARHPGLLDKLAEMCMKPSWKDRENATRTLMHLANENANRKILCTTRILDGLIFGACCTAPPKLAPHPDHDPEHMLKEIQDSAIRAIARLATEVSNRQFMAKHKGLLVTIAKAAERESKLERKGVDEEQQQSFLGKPLLMSLLMAM